MKTKTMRIRRWATAAMACILLAATGCPPPMVVVPETPARNCASTEVLKALLDATDASATDARSLLASGIDDGCLEEKDLITLLDTATASDDLNPVLMFPDSQ